jgi:acyl-coenzyme A thioesterase PaaI-like protein
LRVLSELSMKIAIQDTYSDVASVCYGCGRLNEQGLQIKSYWEGEEVVCCFQPEPYHTAVAGYVYGGLIASLIDCHSTGTAAATAYKEAGREPGTDPPLRYVTASLFVEFLRPTPINNPMTIKAIVTKVEGRRATVSSELFVDNQLCVRGKVVVAKMPEKWLQSLSSV